MRKLKTRSFEVWNAESHHEKEERPFGFIAQSKGMIPREIWNSGTPFTKVGNAGSITCCPAHKSIGGTAAYICSGRCDTS